MTLALILAQCGHWWVETAGPGFTLDAKPIRECSRCDKKETRVEFVTEWTSIGDMLPVAERWDIVPGSGRWLPVAERWAT